MRLRTTGRRLPLALLLLFPFCLGSFGQAVFQPDFARLKKEVEVFENIINTTLGQAISHPMFMAEKARGAYLTNYGVTFTFTVNLNRGFILFAGTAPGGRTKANVDEENERTIATVRRCLMEILWQYGSSITQLSSDGKMSIIAHVLNRSLEAASSTKHVIVMTALRRDFVSAASSRMPLEEFKRKVKVLEY